MVKVCGGCRNSIKDEFYLECSNCTKLFDIICLNMTKAHFKNLDMEISWLCPSCASSRPKGDNSHTPVRSGSVSASGTSEFANVKITRGSGPRGNKASFADLESGPHSDVALLIDEVRQLRKEVQDLRSDNFALKEEIKSYHQVLNNTLMDHSAKLEVVDHEISDLRGTVSGLCHTINTLEQDALRNELEIIGLPELTNENLCHLVLLTSKKLGVAVSEEDIDSVTRVGPKARNLSQDSMKLPRHVVVKLLRRRKRDEIIAAAKSRRNLSSEGITESDPRTIFFNERLTKRNRQLFQAARVRAKKHAFRYCWVQNGVILARRADGKPAVRITSLLDLDQKIGLDTSEDRFTPTPNLQS